MKKKNDRTTHSESPYQFNIPLIICTIIVLVLFFVANNYRNIQSPFASASFDPENASSYSYIMTHPSTNQTIDYLQYPTYPLITPSQTNQPVFYTTLTPTPLTQPVVPAHTTQNDYPSSAVEKLPFQPMFNTANITPPLENDIPTFQIPSSWLYGDSGTANDQHASSQKTFDQLLNSLLPENSAPTPVSNQVQLTTPTGESEEEQLLNLSKMSERAKGIKETLLFVFQGVEMLRGILEQIVTPA